MRKVFIIASSLLLVGAPASLLAQPAPDDDKANQEAADAATSTGEQTEPKEPDVVVTGVREKKVCKRSVPTGSRVAVKVCRTVKEEEEELQATREVMTELQLAGGPVVENAEEGSGIVGPVANPF